MTLNIQWISPYIYLSDVFVLALGQTKLHGHIIVSISAHFFYVIYFVMSLHIYLPMLVHTRSYIYITESCVIISHLFANMSSFKG